MGRTATLLAWVISFVALVAGQIESCGVRVGNPMANQAKNSAARQGDRVPAGTWGGRRVSLEVTEEGAVVEYDCAHGSVAEPLKLDERGNFDARGTHVAERGGPQRAGPPDEGARPARYTGSVSGETMTLVVTLTDTREEVGRYTLKRGESPVIVKCR